MIEDFSVAFPVVLTPRQLAHWTAHPLNTVDKRHFGQYSQHAVMDNGALVGLEYFMPNDRFPEPRLFVNASLLQVHFGDNISMLMTEGEIKQSIARVSGCVAEMKGVPPLDISKGTLHRLDIGYNHLVGEQIKDYLAYLSRCTYPGRQTGLCQVAGTQFLSSSREIWVCTSFTDKFQIFPSPFTHGRLYQKSSLWYPDTIGRLIGAEWPTLRDVRMRVLQQLLQQDLACLGLDKPVTFKRRMPIEDAGMADEIVELPPLSIDLWTLDERWFSSDA